MNTTTTTSSFSFLFLLCSSVTITIFLLPNPTTSYCHPDDARALLDLQKSFGNPPELAFWGNASAGAGSCSCNIYTANCVEGGTNRVTSIFVINVTGLVGTISPSISLLSSLHEIIIMENPNLVGPIPSSIGKLANLTSLRILSNPRLSGPIPSSICDLKKLSSLQLSWNALTGTIPDCFGTKLRVDWIALNRNRLSGPIPRSLGESSISSIDLSENRLTGDASFMFGEKKRHLEWLYLSSNELEFDLSNVRFPLRLVGLFLNNNRIYGRIPTQISKLGRLVFFNASYNHLCGPVPTAGFMKTFDASAFSHNKCLCGGPLQPCH